ncbi:spermidine putrescine ABC transporter permease [Vibrio ishigakensis]|uniref:Spermidine putrescine ABC transporter permease n=1 Tax=Vibrio ishigakensis TaxID=1481914 RepID=A0A0B8PFG6_9VIBR|nr:spermidine putrescine ABC transporter permease [Vibrio ishigakensis]
MGNVLTLRNSIIALIVGWLGLFVFIPNLMIIGTSFLTRDEANLIQMVFTLDNYYRLFDPLYAKVLGHSFYMASVATLLCLVIGYPFAISSLRCLRAGSLLCCFW